MVDSFWLMVSKQTNNQQRTTNNEQPSYANKKNSALFRY